MVRSQSIVDDAASVVFSLDTRRAHLRRRRRRDALREWAGLALGATVAVWLAAVALMTLLSHN